MKIQLMNIGRNKVTRQVEVADQTAVMHEVRKHLMSSDVEIDWNDTGTFGTVLVGGFRAVGEVSVVN